MIDVANLPSIQLPPRLKLPDAAGIYFAISEDDQVLYVGLARSISARWCGLHQRRDQLEAIGNVRIAWLLVDVDRLVETERMFIRHFRPPLNGQTGIPERDGDIDPARLREARERKGLSQAKVAEAVGVQKAAISKIEVGQGLPSANILARLCELYGVEISDITNRAPAPEAA